MGIFESFRTVVKGGFTWPVVKFENRKGDVLEGEYFQSSGEDCPPLPGDTLFHEETQRQGGRSVTGVIDTNPDNKSAAGGEVRRYARDSSGGIVATFHLKNDGTVVLFNDIGTTTIAPDGTITNANANGTTTIAPDGTITNANAGGSTELSTGGVFTVDANMIVTGFTQSATYAGAGGGAASMTADIDMNGNNITDAGEVEAGGINLTSHVHSGVTSGPSNTGGPV